MTNNPPLHTALTDAGARGLASSTIGWRGAPLISPPLAAAGKRLAPSVTAWYKAHMLADDRRLADHDAGAMVDEIAGADPRGRMDVDAGDRRGDAGDQRRDKRRDKRRAKRVQAMRQAMVQDSDRAWIAQHEATEAAARSPASAACTSDTSRCPSRRNCRRIRARRWKNCRT